MTPPLAVLILLCHSLLKHLGSGPLYNKVAETVTGPCQRNWWAALLFIQNYYNPEDICLGHTWYLSVDMQLFILAPLIIYPLYRYHKQVIPILMVLVMFSMGFAFYTSYINEFKVSAADNM